MLHRAITSSVWDPSSGCFTFGYTPPQRGLLEAQFARVACAERVAAHPELLAPTATAKLSPAHMSKLLQTPLEDEPPPYIELLAKA
eukprot:10719083-Lingulodinium_polyedra.AAC.1